MGGKHKQAQRIKNNARPSSSGRSAELLSSRTLPLSSFSSATTDMRFTATLMKPDEFDPSIDSNFSIVLKKLNKKDSITKLKGLQEFTNLVNNSEALAIKIVMPFWCHHYGLLCTDTNHRVREAAQVALQKIVLKDKKLIAPYLKQLIGPWFTSQYDTYAPAASAATHTFQSTFPGCKTQNCILVCQKEILTFISENLNNETVSGTNQANPATDTADANTERAIISSLQSYCMYLDALDSDQIKKNVELNGTIVNTTTFLNLAAHKVPMIKASFFKVVVQVYQKGPFLLESELSKVIPCVLENLDENDPTVVRYVWDAAVLIMDRVQEWWKYISIEKLFFPKLWKVLKVGGHGNATIIYPNLVTLLAALSSPVTDVVNCFYDKFFQNLRSGLDLKQVTASKSESSTIASTLVECLRYVVHINKANTPLCERLIDNYCITVIKDALLLENCSHYKAVFQEAALLIHHWHGNKDQENYAHYLTYFWTNINLLFETILLDVGRDKIDMLAMRQFDLVKNLRQLKPTKTKVTFAACDDGGDNVRNISRVRSCIPYIEDLTCMVYTILDSYVTFIEEKRCSKLFPIALALVRLFESEDFLKGLGEHLTKTANSLVVIYTNLLQNWLTSSDLQSKAVVDLVFLLFKYLNDAEKEQVLKSLVETSDECFGYCVIYGLMTAPYGEDAVLKNWVVSQPVNDYFVTLTRKILRGDADAEQFDSVFQLMFAKDQNNDLLIDEQSIGIMIEMLEEPLLNPESSPFNLSSSIRLLSCILSPHGDYQVPNEYKVPILLGLFRFSCEGYPRSESQKIESLFQDTLRTLSEHLPEDNFADFVEQVALIVQTKFLSASPDHDVADRLALLAVNFIGTVLSVQMYDIVQMVDIFFQRDFVPLWKRAVVERCALADYMCGNLCSPYEELKTDDTLSDEDISKYFLWVYMEMKSLVLLVQLEVVDTVNDVSIFVDLLHDISIAESFLRNYITTQAYRTVKFFYSELKVMLKDIVPDLTSVEQLLVKELKTNAWFYANAIYIFYSEIYPPPFLSSSYMSDIYEKYCNLLPYNGGLSRLHMTQVFGKYLDFDVVQDMPPGAAESALILRSLLHNDQVDVQIAQTLGKIEKMRDKDVPTFLYEKRNQWNQTAEVIEVVRLFSVLVENKMENLTGRNWDLVIISLASWSTNCLKSANRYASPQYQAFVAALSGFFCNVQGQMTKMRLDNPRSNYVAEWKDVFQQNVEYDFLQLWFYFADQMGGRDIPMIFHPLLQQFGRVIDNFSHELIAPNYGLIPNWQKIMKQACSLLLNSTALLQVWGYKMLTVLVPVLVDADIKIISMDSPQDKGLMVEHFKDIISQTDRIMDDLLAGFKLGDGTCQMMPFTDSFTYAFAYLLLWRVFLDMCTKSSPELRYQYADWLKRNGLLKKLLDNLFRLMPAEVLHYNDGKSRSCLKLFEDEPILNCSEICSSEYLEHTACWVYTVCLSQLSAVVRQWWSETDSKVAQIIEKVTEFYVSPQIVHQELWDVTSHDNKFKNMAIKVLPSARQVIAIYTVDEAQVELVLTLPLNYPLGSPDMQCSRQIGGTSHKQWLMQLKKCLLYQNGRIWDGLSLWNSNLDKKFDGIDECTICFAVLHPGTYQLPKLSCRTCKKKFHAACLYKWFSTSNKNTCPICRNLF